MFKSIKIQLAVVAVTIIASSNATYAGDAISDAFEDAFGHDKIPNAFEDTFGHNKIPSAFNDAFGGKAGSNQHKAKNVQPENAQTSHSFN